MLSFSHVHASRRSIKLFYFPNSSDHSNTPLFHTFILTTTYFNFSCQKMLSQSSANTTCLAKKSKVLQIMIKPWWLKLMSSKPPKFHFCYLNFTSFLWICNQMAPMVFRKTGLMFFRKTSFLTLIRCILNSFGVGNYARAVTIRLLRQTVHRLYISILRSTLLLLQCIKLLPSCIDQYITKLFSLPLQGEVTLIIFSSVKFLRYFFKISLDFDLLSIIPFFLRFFIFPPGSSFLYLLIWLFFKFLQLQVSIGLELRLTTEVE